MGGEPSRQGPFGSPIARAALAFTLVLALGLWLRGTAGPRDDGLMSSPLWLLGVALGVAIGMLLGDRLRPRGGRT
jgi:hypothetical protein